MRNCKESGSVSTFAQLLDSLPTLLPRDIPTLTIQITISLNILGHGVQRKVRGSERQIVEEGLSTVLCSVIPQAVHRVIGDRCCRVVTRARFDGRPDDH